MINHNAGEFVDVIVDALLVTSACETIAADVSELADACLVNIDRLDAIERVARAFLAGEATREQLADAIAAPLAEPVGADPDEEDDDGHGADESAPELLLLGDEGNFIVTLPGLAYLSRHEDDHP